MNIFARRDASANTVQTTPTYFRFDTCARDRRRGRRRRRCRRRRRGLLPPPSSSTALPSPRCATRTAESRSARVANRMAKTTAGRGYDWGL